MSVVLISDAGGEDDADCDLELMPLGLPAGRDMDDGDAGDDESDESVDDVMDGATYGTGLDEVRRPDAAD